jgi:hypothetical protein|nr:MAG TPA: Dna polymerase B [Caudoviricetes sp.]
MEKFKFLEVKNLSWKAKGILIYLLTNKNLISFHELKNISKEGNEAIYSGLKELVEKGYISRVKFSDGTIEYNCFNNPEKNNVKDFLGGEK